MSDERKEAWREWFPRQLGPSDRKGLCWLASQLIYVCSVLFLMRLSLWMWPYSDNRGYHWLFALMIFGPVCAYVTWRILARLIGPFG